MSNGTNTTTDDGWASVRVFFGLFTLAMLVVIVVAYVAYTLGHADGILDHIKFQRCTDRVLAEQAEWRTECPLP